MKPFEAEMSFTIAAEDLDAVVALWERVVEFATELGFNLETGDIGLMKAEDIIPDSPLAKAVD